MGAVVAIFLVASAMFYPKLLGPTVGILFFVACCVSWGFIPTIVTFIVLLTGWSWLTEGGKSKGKEKSKGKGKRK